MTSRIARRALLRKAAVAAGGLIILKDAASAFSYQANEKLATAHVGVGGRGGDLLHLAFLKASNPVAFCDVNESKAARVYGLRPDVPRFKDFREMLDKMGKQIDAVVVATPDHTHAVASAAAIRAGKHVYTEKPLSRTIHESRVLRALAREHKVATSMGNQGTASGPYRRALELIRGGTIGAVKEVHVWNDGGGPGHKEAPADEGRVPPYLDWDLWLGPARQRPFNVRWLGWHGWRDFGTCNLGNWGSHTANLAFRALDVASLWDAPAAGAAPRTIKVEARVPEVNRLSFPRWEVVRWHVPARSADLPPVTLHWYTGHAHGHREQIEAMLGRGLDWGDKGQKKWADFAGCLIVGDKGSIHSTGHNATFTLLPEAKFDMVGRDRPEKLEPSRGHEQEWIAACRGGKPAWASYEYAAPLNEFLQLGNLATQFEGPLEYDPVAGKVVNEPPADKLLHYEYRKGWAL